jgi:hypothetical protein
LPDDIGHLIRKIFKPMTDKVFSLNLSPLIFIGRPPISPESFYLPLWQRGIEGDLSKDSIRFKSPLAPLFQRGVQVMDSRSSSGGGMTLKTNIQFLDALRSLPQGIYYHKYAIWLSTKEPAQILHPSLIYK